MLPAEQKPLSLDELGISIFPDAELGPTIEQENYRSPLEIMADMENRWEGLCKSAKTVDALIRNSYPKGVEIDSKIFMEPRHHLIAQIDDLLVCIVPHIAVRQESRRNPHEVATISFVVYSKKMKCFFEQPFTLDQSHQSDSSRRTSMTQWAEDLHSPITQQEYPPFSSVPGQEYKFEEEKTTYAVHYLYRDLQNKKGKIPKFRCKYIIKSDGLVGVHIDGLDEQYKHFITDFAVSKKFKEIPEDRARDMLEDIENHFTTWADEYEYQIGQRKAQLEPSKKKKKRLPRFGL